MAKDQPPKLKSHLTNLVSRFRYPTIPDPSSQQDKKIQSRQTIPFIAAHSPPIITLDLKCRPPFPNTKRKPRVTQHIRKQQSHRGYGFNILKPLARLLASRYKLRVVEGKYRKNNTGRITFSDSDSDSPDSALGSQAAILRLAYCQRKCVHDSRVIPKNHIHRVR